MTVYTSLNAGIAQLQALASHIDSGSGNATFVFYSDTKPTSVATAAVDSAKLVTLNLPKPSLKQVLADGIELNPTDTGTVLKSGTATWARLFNGAGQPVADFAVGTDISLDNTALVQGGSLNITSIKLKPFLG